MTECPPKPGSVCVVVRPPGGEPYVLSLERLTEHVRAARVLRMGRLADKLAKASDAIAGVETAVEKDVDNIIKRTEEIHKKRENVFLKKQMHLDTQVTDLAEFERDLEDFGKNDHSGAGGRSSDAYASTRTTSK